ncbi:UNVERIFIED_CONTAM: hypothetical protein HDU68_010214 [Siphonaria sp. JEL0065]|nr:hypothetical protein HDU68_010214 [Siphonaria sp. JEL0065]
MVAASSTSSKKQLRVGCVPEHFSIPFFHAKPTQTSFKVVNCPGGTGQMVKALKEGEADIVVALTEGLVAGLAKGEEFTIVGSLTKSPLTWSVAVAPSALQEGGAFAGCQNDGNNAQLIRGKRIGISRFGSGSHLITFVIPSVVTPSEEYSFVQQNDIVGLRSGITTGTTDAFLWERFTTKKYVDSGELAVLGSVTPPWPAFMFACRNSILETQEGRESVRDFLDSVSEAIHLSVYESTVVEGGQKRVQDGIIPEICERFGYAHADVASWFETVEFATDCAHVDKASIEKCLTTLKSAGVLEADAMILESQLGL